MNFTSTLPSSSCSSSRVIKSYFYCPPWFKWFLQNPQRCFSSNIHTLNTSHNICSWSVSLSNIFLLDSSIVWIFQSVQLWNLSQRKLSEILQDSSGQIHQTCSFWKTFWERIWPLQIPRNYTLFTGTHVRCWITRFSSTSLICSVPRRKVAYFFREFDCSNSSTKENGRW